MAFDARVLLLLGASLVPSAAIARPDRDVGAATLLERHRLPRGEAAATGRALLAAGDIAGALAAYQQAVAEEPGSTGARNGLAACYERLGRDDLARQAYEQALAGDPASDLVQVNLGGLLVRTGHFAPAIPLLQQAAASSDARVAAAARRLLTLAGTAIRDRAVLAQHAAAVAPQALAVANATPTHVPSAAPAFVAAPPVAEVRLAEGVSIVTTAPARIIAAGAGEVRLVASAPAPELVARLGDDAALAEPPRPWRREEEAQLRRSVASDAVALATPPNHHLPVPVLVRQPTTSLPLAVTERIVTRSTPPDIRQTVELAAAPVTLGARPAAATPRRTVQVTIRRAAPAGGDARPTGLVLLRSPAPLPSPALLRSPAQAGQARLVPRVPLVTVPGPVDRHRRNHAPPHDLTTIAQTWRRFLVTARPTDLAGFAAVLRQAMA